MSMDKLSSRFERILKIMKIYNYIFFWQESNLSVGQREMCLLARERSVCWQERDLSVSKREICLLARERCVSWQERCLSVGKRDLYVGKRGIWGMMAKQLAPARHQLAEPGPRGGVGEG